MFVFFIIFFPFFLLFFPYFFIGFFLIFLIVFPYFLQYFSPFFRYFSPFRIIFYIFLLLIILHYRFRLVFIFEYLRTPWGLAFAFRGLCMIFKWTPLIPDCYTINILLYRIMPSIWGPFAMPIEFIFPLVISRKLVLFD